MSRTVGKVAALLFGSGLCALVYQVAWLREMRFIFGASTAASAAVLAIFMGGLGAGGAVLGRRADRHPQPLAFYANLELMIALSAAATPGLVWAARQVYIALGGSVVLGLGVATVVRLLLAALVLCLPTFLMGGTLPAAAKAVETDADLSRRHVAMLYGINTLGAVTGAFICTFVLLEVFGTRTTLWLACLVNLLVAMVARGLARSLSEPLSVPDPAARPALPDAVPSDRAAVPPTWFVLGAAAVVGFAFLLMELVWYRTLGPLLGGSSFTFGLILAVALLGIGLGGASYAVFGNSRPATLAGFALTCTVEAACIAVPYALGDRIALVTILLRALGSLGFSGLVVSWAAVASLVVLPAAFVAGVQFPLLIALLGRGREQVGRHVGLAYASNTLGAIIGSLAGGFGLLPLLTATGTWCLVVAVLVFLGLGALALAAWQRERMPALLMPAGAAAAAVLMLGARGPTAAWRHSPIGAGRVRFDDATRNTLRDWTNGRRRVITWQAEGVESSVAIEASDGLAFVVNGKSDGNSRLDAATQVMGGLVGAILHPQPRRSMVIGLGTGSTAGWLGVVPGMERVDVVELEPAILEVARMCAPVNHDVMTNPRVHPFIGDAREVLLTTSEHYDVVFSEPSNPYRAGVASLFTHEFYHAVASRLTEHGIFLQWLQTYEVDSQTIRTAYATLASVFPYVETWHTHQADLLLVASMRPIDYDVPRLRARVAQEPFKSALAATWRVEGLEGFLSRYVASPALARAVAGQEGSFLNTDDQTLIEYAFARSVGRPKLFDFSELRATAALRNEDRPELHGGEVRWERVEDQRVAESPADADRSHLSDPQRQRALARKYYAQGHLDKCLTAWRAQAQEPAGPLEVMMIAEATADQGDEAARRYIEQLRAYSPAEADIVLAVLRWRQQRLADAADALEAAFARYRTDPWPLPELMERGLDLATEIAAQRGALAGRMYTLLKEPFSLKLLNEQRLAKVVAVAGLADFNTLCADAAQPLEPNVFWRRDFLTSRWRCYEARHHPKAAEAKRDLLAFLAGEPVPFGRGLQPAVAHAAR